MPRLSLYKPEKGKDYKFIDRQIYEMFQVGGTDVNIHKYVGTDDGTTVKDHTQIQDLLFLENRDRKYDEDIYTIRGIYNVQDIDFDLSQFGLFLQNDTLFMTVHINSSVDALGRKIMPGDVLELPHLKDEFAENDYEVALKRFYVVEDVNRAAEGFSPTWYPHLYRIKMKQILDSQEYKDILDLPMNEEEPEQGSLRDLLSTYEKEMQINDAVIAEAEADASKSGYDTTHLYTLQVDDGKSSLTTVDDSNINVASSQTVDTLRNTPTKLGYSGYLLGSDDAPNGAPFGSGISFPNTAAEGDYFLRIDFLPNRLFRYDGQRWVKMQDNLRMTMTNTEDRQTQKGTFINNNRYTYMGNIAVDSVRLSLGDTEVFTDIEYPTTTTPVFVVLQLNHFILDYVVADHPTMLTTYTKNGKTLIKATIPDEIISDGLWEIGLFEDRVAERQGLSKALRPRSDN